MHINYSYLDNLETYGHLIYKEKCTYRKLHHEPDFLQHFRWYHRIVYTFCKKKILIPMFLYVVALVTSNMQSIYHSKNKWSNKERTRFSISSTVSRKKEKQNKKVFLVSKLLPQKVLLLVTCEIYSINLVATCDRNIFTSSSWPSLPTLQDCHITMRYSD